MAVSRVSFTRLTMRLNAIHYRDALIFISESTRIAVKSRKAGRVKCLHQIEILIGHRRALAFSAFRFSHVRTRSRASSRRSPRYADTVCPYMQLPGAISRRITLISLRPRPFAVDSILRERRRLNVSCRPKFPGKVYAK